MKGKAYAGSYTDFLNEPMGAMIRICFMLSEQNAKEIKQMNKAKNSQSN